MRDQGCPDPRRPARPWCGTARRGRIGHGAGHPARPPVVRRRAEHPGPSSGPRACRGRHRRARGRRCGRGAGPRAACGSAGNGLECRPGRLAHVGSGRRTNPALRRRRGGPAFGRDGCRDRPGAARSGWPLYRGRTLGFAAAGARQCAADRTQLLFGGSQGHAVEVGLGDRRLDGRFATRALPVRSRRVAEVGRIVGVGHLRDAQLRR